MQPLEPRLDGLPHPGGDLAAQFPQPLLHITVTGFLS